MAKDMDKLLESLSPNERKILPHLEEKNIIEICKKSNLDKVSVIRSLEYLKNKGALDIVNKIKKIVNIGVNGALYLKKGLPERRLLNVLNEKRIVKLSEASKEANLSEDEFKASLGILKRRNLIELKNGKIIFNGSKEEISKKSSEELFIESLPLYQESLNPEQSETLKALEKRRDIIKVEEQKITELKITPLGKEIIDLRKEWKGLVEQITPEILKKESLWKGKKFRRYDVTLPVPQINGGKRHFVNQATDYARDVWSEMGFKEMTGDLVMSSFWNFDSLFQPQDHPAREMHDTFFIDKKLQHINAEKNLIKNIKESHEKGVGGSTGWNYSWSEDEAKRLILRTHTTSISAQTLAKIDSKKLPQKFFAVGRCFRNETLDWSHGFEFNQTEGIVVDKNANFRHLLGYLKEFFKKMGYEKLRFRPGYFPYTEPSVEIDFYHKEKKVWLELGGAGIFRPEVVIPLLGENIPVLAWGPGFDRMIMNYYEIKDLREMYKNDLTQLRKMKFWMK